jgi:hypothetical protein
MSKNSDSMPAIINRKTESETNEEPLETKSEGEEAVEDLKDSE